MTQEVTENAAPRHWGVRSRVRFELDFEGRATGVLLRPLVRHQARRAAPVSYRTLKRLLEGPELTRPAE